MIFNEYTSTNEQETANLFSDYFSSVYSTKQMVLDVGKPNKFVYDLLNNATFSVDDVYRSLSSLKNVWSTDLSGHFLFELRSVIASMASL